MVNSENLNVFEGVGAIDELENDLEIKKPEMAADVYRRYYDKDKQEIELKDSDVNYVYHLLTKPNKIVINNMISYLMPPKYSKNYVRDYYFKIREYLKTHKYKNYVSNNKIAHMISVKVKCQKDRFHEDGILEDSILKMLKRLPQNQSVTLQNQKYLSAFCDMFSIEPDIIEKGHGDMILLDEKEIDKLLLEKGKTPSEFIVKTIKWKCEKCKAEYRKEHNGTDKDCDCETEYCQILQYNQKELAENMANILDVSVEKILIRIPITILLEDDLCIDRYRLLSIKDQETIYELMKNLYYTQYATPICNN